jgi:hypothetical protein
MGGYITRSLYRNERARGGRQGNNNQRTNNRTVASNPMQAKQLQ